MTHPTDTKPCELQETAAFCAAAEAVFGSMAEADIKLRRHTYAIARGIAPHPEQYIVTWRREGNILVLLDIVEASHEPA